ncbi:S-adenosyl-L-methionine-dependent methyltransferase [Parachaetomium inaequale]|uniref:S-adenosyl-L-methionine-dependent methyltransferase n=1 Tax=Parachaetomium inaequale TaxID=2588326 RepID=A0AAN6P723_9PEZI|nr:S-adenosyl-L-methionine-dependent methyltransferase [Parachaetomium inaequale]
MVSLKPSAFEPKAESRPSKRARASSADGDVRDAAAAYIDKNPATPRRDPRPDLQRPSTTDLLTRPHAVLDDSEHPRPEGQYHPGIVSNSDETSSITSTSSGRDDDPHTDESVFDDRDDIPSIADRRNLPEDQYHPTDAEDELEEDEFEFTEGYETGSTGSTSVTPSVYDDCTFENGRRYQNFKNGCYPIPNDDKELNRQSMEHAMMMELCDGQWFYAPIEDQPQMILDIGAGTGDWAIEVGNQYPNTRVRGVDASPVQPVWVPPNVDFLVDDCEQGEWLDQDVDFVHFRFMTIVLKDVRGVLRRAYESLKPGGWVELQELCAEVLCDDGTMPDNDPVKYMYELAQRAFTKFDMNVTLPKDLEHLLLEAGFESIQCVVKKVPIGGWARDKKLRVIGTYQKMVVEGFMSVLRLRPFTALGMSQDESQEIVDHARKALADTTVHRHLHYFVWFAQKPE